MRRNKEALLVKRTELLNQIFADEGFCGIIRLLKCDNIGEANSLDIYQIAKAFAATNKPISELEIRGALSNENDSILNFMCFYISARQKSDTDTWEWIDAFNLDEWGVNEFARFFVSLPFVRNVWDRIKKHSQDKIDAYWKNVYIKTICNRINTSIDAAEHEYVLENLIKYERYELVLVYISRCVGRHLSPQRQIEILKTPAVSEYMKKSRETAMIVRKLQVFSEEDVSIKDDILHFEWEYLTILFGNAIKPKIIADKLVSDGTYFRSIVKKSNNEENREEAEKAINLLNHSTDYPRQVDNMFNETGFFKWVIDILGGNRENTDELSEKCRYYIGRIVYYKLQNNIDLWDNTKIIEFLNKSDKTLEGYKDAVLGWHRTSFGKQGSHSKEEIERQLEFAVYRKKQVEEKGLRRLVNAFTEIEVYCKRWLGDFLG